MELPGVLGGAVRLEPGDAIRGECCSSSALRYIIASIVVLRRETCRIRLGWARRCAAHEVSIEDGHIEARRLTESDQRIRRTGVASHRHRCRQSLC